MNSLERFKEENKRHENKIKEIIEKSHLPDIKDTIKKNKKLRKEIKDQRILFTKQFYPVVDHIIRDENNIKRVTIDNTITIRDRNVYSHDTPNRLDFDIFIKKFKDIYVKDETGKLKDLEDIFLEMADQNVDVHVGNNFYILLENMELERIYIINKERKDLRKILNDNFKINHFEKYDIKNIDYTEDKDILKNILVAEEDLKEAVDEEQERLKNQKEIEEESFEKIKNRLSDEFSLVTVKMI